MTSLTLQAYPYEVVGTTPQLILRELEISDEQAFFKLTSDVEVMRFSFSGPRTLEQSNEILKDFRASYLKHGLGKWGVFRKETFEFIGYCGLMLDQVQGQLQWEVGFRFFPAYWNRGYATEAATLALKIGFARGVDTIVGFSEPRNKASIQVLKKLGMEYNGLFLYNEHEMELYHLQRENFLKTEK
jgi:RimJ/RimL family protein N-acetyltransferase